MKIRRIRENHPHPWRSVFKKEFLILFFALFFENGFAQWEKFAFSAEASPLLMYDYDQYENVHYKNDYNYLFGLGASAFVIDRKIDLAIHTGLFLKTKNYHSEDWSMKIQWPEKPIKTEQKYIYLSVPLTLKCELETGKNYLGRLGFGVSLYYSFYVRRNLNERPR